MRELILIGVGGHARAVISVINRIPEFNLKYIIDPDFKNNDEKILGHLVNGSLELLKNLTPENFEIFLAIGDDYLRYKISKQPIVNKFKFINIIDPTSICCSSSIMGHGNFIGPMAHIGPNTKMGDFNILNTQSNLEHESIIGNFCQLAPSATICGRCKIGNKVYFGANSTVIEKISINHENTIGAGSVIIKDIKQTKKTFIGIPGKIK